MFRPFSSEGWHAGWSWHYFEDHPPNPLKSSAGINKDHSRCCSSRLSKGRNYPTWPLGVIQHLDFSWRQSWQKSYLCPWLKSTTRVMSSSQSPDSSSNPAVSSSSSPSNVVNGHLNNNAHRLRVTMSLADMKQVQQSPTSTSNEGPPTSPIAIPSPALRGMDQRRGSLATPEEFVRKFQGKRAINKVLIANNGIAGNLIKVSPVIWTRWLTWEVCIIHFSREVYPFDPKMVVREFPFQRTSHQVRGHGDPGGS